MDLVLLVLMIVLIVLVPQTIQIRMRKLCTEEFRHIKLNYLGVLFRVGGGRTATKDGIVIPMLYVQIQGYALAIILGLMGVIWLDFDLPRPDIYYIIFIVSFFLHMVSVCLVVMFTLSEGHRRRARKEAVAFLKEAIRDLIRIGKRPLAFDTTESVLDAWNINDYEYSLSLVRNEKVVAGIEALCANFTDIQASLGAADSIFDHPMWREQICIAEDVSDALATI